MQKRNILHAPFVSAVFNSYGRDMGENEEGNKIFPITSENNQDIKNACNKLDEKINKRELKNVKTFKPKNLDKYISNLIAKNE